MRALVARMIGHNPRRNHRLGALLAAALIAACSSAPALQEGKLDEIRAEVDSPRANEGSSVAATGSWLANSLVTDAGGFSSLAFYVLLSPFTVPHGAVGAT